METEYKMAMQNFRVSIRKRQIDRLFQQNRIHLLNAQKDECSEELSFKLNDRGYRQKWINEIALLLTGEPTKEWQNILLQIFHSVKAFKDEHSSWVQLGIIKALTEVFKPQYEDLGLGKIASQVLADVIYLCHTSDHKVIKNILSYGFLDFLIQRLLTIFQTEHLRLIAVIAKTVPDLRDHLKIKGCFQIALDRVRNSKIKNTQEIKVCLFFIKTMVSICQVDGDTYLFPKKTVVFSSLQLMNEEILQNYLGSSLKIILGICAQICALDKQQIFNKIMKFPSLIDKALQMLTFQQDFQVCKKSSNFFSKLLLSKNPQHTQVILNMGILDQIRQACRIFSHNDSVSHSLLSILSNLTADFDFSKERLLYHPLLIEFVFNCVQNSPCIEVQREAVYVICNFFHDIDESWINKILGQLKICELLIGILIRSEDTKSIQQIIQGFSALLIKVGKPFAQMLNFYRIEDVLANIENEALQQSIWSFLQSFGQIKSDDYWIE